MDRPSSIRGMIIDDNMMTRSVTRMTQLISDHAVKSMEKIADRYNDVTGQGMMRTPAAILQSQEGQINRLV